MKNVSSRLQVVLAFALIVAFAQVNFSQTGKGDQRAQPETSPLMKDLQLSAELLGEPFHSKDE